MPIVLVTAFISRSSVTTRPLKPSSMRKSSWMMVRLVVAMWSGSTFGYFTCAVITMSSCGDDGVTSSR